MTMTTPPVYLVLLSVWSEVSASTKARPDPPTTHPNLTGVYASFHSEEVCSNYFGGKDKGCFLLAGMQVLALDQQWIHNPVFS